MEGYRISRAASADFARRSAPDYSQAMVVALGFYLFGHLADLLTTIGFLHGGMPECNPFPALILEAGGMPGLIALKVLGALATAWVFWRLRARLFTVFFTSALAVLLIFVASVNSLDVIEALAMGAIP
ncbi:MAG: hypothetical protein HPY83_07705 [Anaerolineae bacterium]|nr:hypothetical protein [Anaerolineae bacterium]